MTSPRVGSGAATHCQTPRLRSPHAQTALPPGQRVDAAVLPGLRGDGDYRFAPTAATARLASG